MSTIKKGKFILILGPSGVGKGTTINMLKERHPEFVFPVSCTTRPMRPGEENGKQYFFISEEEFKERIENGEFLEYAFIHQQQYSGVLKSYVETPLKEGKIVVREVNVEGWESIMDSDVAPYVRSIFMTVADKNLLIDRIQKRSKLSEEEIAHRIESAMEELAHIDRYDVVVETIEGAPETVYNKVESAILQQ